MNHGQVSDDTSKRLALKMVSNTGRVARKAADERVSSWRYASQEGASIREIAAADGDVSHMTVERALTQPEAES